ncbi:hypothetical protein AB6A40_005123 [Gnathostoma spinigerum]|uniref:Uncharacterized protein n=1 Tax=Gnathostoma spinigerum TaxID=75299 RepID=A0ABD6EJT8_9BILA
MYEADSFLFRAEHQYEKSVQKQKRKQREDFNGVHLSFEPQPCALCEKPADVKCPECFLTKDVLLSDVTFCSDCFRKSHAVNDHQFQRISSPKILDPQTLPLSSPNVSSGTNKCGRHKMQLSAVICIETSHYVSFVRTNSSNDWLFFDSMADRCGFDNGYNIPEVILCSGISSWLSVDGYRRLRSAVAHEGHLPPEVEADRHLNRLLSDGYMCIYSMENGCYGSSEKGLKVFEFYSFQLLGIIAGRKISMTFNAFSPAAFREIDFLATHPFPLFWLHIIKICRLHRII